MHHVNSYCSKNGVNLPPPPHPPIKSERSWNNFSCTCVLYFLSQVILVWGSSLTSCKRQEPRPDEIEVVINVTHSIIWKCSVTECHPGSGMNIPCGTSVAIGTPIECVYCVKGVNYSDTNDYSQCKSCRDCSPHEKSSGNCTTTEDASRCLEICRKGFYWNNVTNACDQCSVCCGQPPTNHEKQCEDSGLPVTLQCRETPLLECVDTYEPKLDNSLSSKNLVIIVMTVTTACTLFAVICVCGIRFSLWKKFKKSTGRGSQETRELTVSLKKLQDDDDLESISVYRSASYAEGADNKRILTSG